LLIGRYESERKLLHEVFHSLAWTLFEAEDPRYALSCLRQNLVHVVIANADLPHWSWKEILEDVHSIKPTPLLIVTSRTADDHLWAEVLNMGGFDVLAQPFDRVEVERVLASARRHFNPPRPIHKGRVAPRAIA
jgi:DNA-binding response OmpR family regulator